MRSTLILPIAASLALVACGKKDDTPTDAASSVADMDTAATAGADVTAPAMDATAVAPASAQSFADTVAASDKFEIESAKIAQSKSKSAAVKDFAAMLVKDHTASTSKLKTAATSLKPAVTPSATLTASQEADLAALKSATDNFDQLFMQQQIAAHAKALTLLQGYGASGDAQALKDFAKTTADVVEGHLNKARDLKP